MNTVLNNTSAEVNSRNTYILDKKENRVMRLFVLSSGYVAHFTNSLDEEYWGCSVIPLAFGSEVHAQRAVDIMTQANPENLVVFSGGLAEYTAFISLDRLRQ